MLLEQAPHRRAGFRGLLLGRGFEHSARLVSHCRTDLHTCSRICFCQDRDDIARNDRRAVFDANLLENTGGRGRHFEHNLVRLQINEILVALDVLANPMVPCDQGRIGD